MRRIRAGMVVLWLLILIVASPTSPVTAAPVLTIAPSSGPPDTIFAVRGAGLTPQERYFATASEQNGALHSSVEFQADEAGRFAVAYNSADTPPGRYTVAIVQSGGPGRTVASAPLVVTSSRRQCFPQTDNCLDGIFLEYWQAHGGLAINGYPITEPIQITLEDGESYVVQYCERVRLEYHPEHVWPYDVQLGQFGRRIHPADPPAARLSGATYYAETGHNLRAGFREYWNKNGGLAQFGFPITEEITEQLEDGRVYTVQYFERARFEYHPENKAPYDILLGQFGRRIHDEYNGPVRIPGIHIDAPLSGE